MYRFHHDGEERMYVASADWMKRNLSRRIEVALPVYDPAIGSELSRALELQLSDNSRETIVDTAESLIREGVVEGRGGPSRTRSTRGG